MVEEYNNWNEKIEEIKSKINEAKEWISELEDRVVEISAIEKKKMKKNEDRLTYLWDNIKCTNICIVGAPLKKERAWENTWRYNSWKLP